MICFLSLTLSRRSAVHTYGNIDNLATPVTAPVAVEDDSDDDEPPPPIVSPKPTSLLAGLSGLLPAIDLELPPVVRAPKSATLLASLSPSTPVNAPAPAEVPVIGLQTCFSRILMRKNDFILLSIDFHWYVNTLNMCMNKKLWV